MRENAFPHTVSPVVQQHNNQPRTRNLEAA
jgi:hypothetical protein